MARTTRTRVLALLLLLASRPVVGNAVGVEITYLANEGFLIAAGEAKLVIDALFPGLDGYPRVPGRLVADLDAGRPPFDGIDLALATHHHPDHFGASEVARFLSSNPLPFLSSGQAVERLRAVGAPPTAISPGPGEAAVVEAAGITVRTLDLHHGPGGVENLGFLIEVEGLKILHIGDTEATLEDFKPLGLAEAGIDVALLPVWYLTEPQWREVVVEAIRPGRIVAMHLAERTAPASWFGSAGGFERRIEQIENAWPDAWIPTEALDCRRYDPAALDRLPVVCAAPPG